MERIQQEDSIVIPTTPDRAFQVLADLHAYKDWWPRTIRFRFEDEGPVRVGTKMRISNQGSVNWTAEVTAIEPGKRIAFQYGEGAWEGAAGWTLTPENGGVRVAYAIDIVPVPLWIRILGKVVDLGKMHSRQMRDILKRLESHLQPKDR